MHTILKQTILALALIFAENLTAKEIKLQSNLDIYKTIKSDLIKANGKKAKITKEIVKKQFLLIYFSAHWCPPCRKFTPQLVKWYNKDHKNFDVILVSADQTKKAMKNYMEEMKMPWFGIKKGSRSEKWMSQVFKTGGGIPNLVLVENGKIIASSYDKGKYLGPAKAYQTMLKKLETIKKNK
jgi:nucleoredoxin